ncbi:MAG: hypothetical protein BZY87_10035 [SAR202 cluster bacterium Io17-Chloro-G6]|nr:MAG: hypothetical protein BZY87_10035 [SAR202 cluster bacterium Io17-Chloro-G6]
MQQTQEQPLHWDDPRTKLNLTLIFALVVVVIGVIGQNPFLFIIGAGVAIYSWLTNAKQYLIYRDALVIVYGRPRVKSFHFDEIANLETLALPMGERLRVRFVNGRRIMLMTRDSETFRAKLDEALEAFHGGQRDTDYEQETGRETRTESLPESPNESPQDYNQEARPEAELPEEQRRLGESSTEDDNVPY